MSLHAQLKSGFIEINADNTSALYSATIGPKNAQGEEVFYFKALTPSGLAAELNSHPKLFGKGYIFLPSISEDGVKKEIEALLSKISGHDWNEVALKISRYGDWEFEDHNHGEEA
jgi:hypothetical protein